MGQNKIVYPFTRVSTEDVVSSKCAVGPVDVSSVNDS